MTICERRIIVVPWRMKSSTLENMSLQVRERAETCRFMILTFFIGDYQAKGNGHLVTMTTMTIAASK